MPVDITLPDLGENISEGGVLEVKVKPGDVVVMSMFVAHGSLDNHTSDKSIRLSFDVRYQPKNEPIDERFGNERQRHDQDDTDHRRAGAG